MTQEATGLILGAFENLRRELSDRDDALEHRIGKRLDHMEEVSSGEHADTLRRVLALERAVGDAATAARTVVRVVQCAAGGLASLSALAGLLALTGVL